MKYSKPKKYLVKNLRRNERRMTTKKAKRAQRHIALAILFMLIATALINWANSSETITIENKNWDVRITAESPKAQPEAQDEATDGILADREETERVESHSPSDVVRMIEEKFGEKAQEAIAIASCESRLVPDRVGDSHLAFEKDGQKYGESYGLFQIRSGGKGWVRTNNVEQFKKDMFTPEKNIETAKKLLDAHGDWSPWYNCAVKNNLI